MESGEDQPACVKACTEGCLSVVDVKEFATGLQQSFEMDNSLGTSTPRNLSPSGDLAASTEGLCVFCGTCEIVCPTNAIKIVDDHAEIDKSRCIMCGHVQQHVQS
jgi:ferredoxin